MTPKFSDVLTNSTVNMIKPRGDLQYRIKNQKPVLDEHLRGGNNP